MTTVTIGGREFRIGAWYRPSAEAAWRKPAKLERVTRGGAMVWYNIGGEIPVMTLATSWLAWAGDEVTK